jgi:hypothetical protein
MLSSTNSLNYFQNRTPEKPHVLHDNLVRNQAVEFAAKSGPLRGESGSRWLGRLG